MNGRKIRFFQRKLCEPSPVSLPKDAMPPTSQRKLLQIPKKTQNSQSLRPPMFPTIWYKLATAVLALHLLVYRYIHTEEQKHITAINKMLWHVLNVHNIKTQWIVLC